MINSIEDAKQLEILLAKAQPVTFPLIQADLDFIEKLYAEVKGLKIAPLGIAANQIAESVDYIPRMFLALFDFEEKESEELDENGKPKMVPDHEKPIFQLFINPKIKLSGGTIKSPEGCLSVPGPGKIIKRKKNVTITYNDVNGNEFTAKLNGDQSYLSLVIQHEYDHLEGLLITSQRLKKHGLRI